MENLLSLVFIVFLVLSLPLRQNNVLVRAAYVYGVDDRDVEGLSNLVDWFSILSLSFGNPCLEGAQWTWVECSSDDPPRITALNLKSYTLDGTIPDFSTMDALETIDMRNNYLKGTIPSFLGNLPNLKELDLAYNDLSGPLPSSLTKNNKISLDATGNTDLCSSSSNACTNSDTSSSSTDSEESTSEGGQKKKSSKLKLILAIVIPVFILFWAVLGICFVMQQKKKSAAALAAINAGKQGGNNEPAYGTTTATQDMANGMEMMGQMGETVNNEYNQMNVVDHNNAQNYHQAQQ